MEERVVAYASRRLNPAESNYDITQLEALAVVWAVELFRDPYLGCKKFKLITDHRALLKIQNMPGENNRALQRWSLKLQEYDMDIEYKPGATLHNADCLSRQEIMQVVNSLILRMKEDSLKKLQSEDELWSEMYRRLWNAYLNEETKETDGTIDKDSQEILHQEGKYDCNSIWIGRFTPKWSRYFLNKDGVMFREMCHGGITVTRLCLPRKLAGEVLTRFHEEGHWGAN